MAPARSRSSRSGILQHINAPLGFYVLSLLIVEAALGLVLTGLKEEDRWSGFLCMMGIFVLVIVIVTVLVIGFPKNLVFGKEEHSAPLTDPSALRDQIEDLIVVNVKPECLKDRPR